jgi:hypothetical protein
MEPDNKKTEAAAVASLIELTVDSWRFSRLFLKLLNMLNAGERGRYESQIRYFLKKMVENLDAAGMRLVQC